MRTLNIATMQYGLSDVQTENQFWDRLSLMIKDAVDRGAKLLLFPEYLTAHLLSFKPAMTHYAACHYLDSFTDAYRHFFQQSSCEYGVAIVGGTHITQEKGGFVNKASLFFPDGRIEEQNKLHLTPEERDRWSLIEGDRLNIVDTKWGRIAIAVCYDIEFPELARVAAERGATMILCPSYTDTVFGYHRVRLCSQARAIENQLFVVLSGIVGSLPEKRPQIDYGYCQAGVFTPCDLPFTEKGIAAIGEENQHGMVMANIDFAHLQENRQHGVVAPFYDRRPDLYDKAPD
ncbi:putative amidohydrolase [Paenibacillus castaneae]|uniref:carbon-nitrogen hydrolase family protein n=1 Tax=Paenibacillus castaneae TaxID=474957 RepID=UPI000C9C5322|nr:carbon-nitrogen hydrolase family protein [Paenibacillus castaneae]NIK79147.1 putative amidohydrolase [Paenibacillus castaneae]